MSWFENLTGVAETSPEQVRAQLKLEGDELVCPNGQRIACGTLEIPTLGELRSRARSATIPGKLSARQLVGDVRQLHADPQHAGALFQVASQFNLLEMTSPTVTPEEGVGIDEHDPTQGPACAIACGGGTIYRNYFVPVGETVGSAANRCCCRSGRVARAVAVAGWPSRFSRGVQCRPQRVMHARYSVRYHDRLPLLQ